MEVNNWITKDETNYMAANNGYHGQQQQQYSNVRALLQQQQQQHQINNFCVSDEYYQSLDNLAFCLDDFFVPDNDSCAQAYAQYAEKKPSQEQMQQKVHQSLLVSEPMAALNVKTEQMDHSNSSWSNANAGGFACQSPDSGIHLDPSFSPNSDAASSASSSSISPGMPDLESPRSVSSVDSGILTPMTNGQNEVGLEIYHDLIMRHLVQDIKATCVRLSIPQDPKLWSPTDCRAWLTDMSAQYHLTQVPYDKLCMNGETLCSMSLAQFNHCFPSGGETVHAQLQIWNSANEYCKRQASSNNASRQLVEESAHEATFMVPHGTADQQDMSEYMAAQLASTWGQMACANNTAYSLAALLPSPGSCSDSGLSTDFEPAGDEGTVVGPTSNTSNNNIQLWQFLRELLDQQDNRSRCVRWIDRSAGIFKIEDSHKLARVWGQRKNRPAMNYDKLSRSLRQYYKKNILKKTTRSQRLVYQFLHPYHVC